MIEIKNNKRIIIFFVIATTTAVLSLWSPTGRFIATPKYWWDEAFTVELARTFMERGKLDITVAPNTISGIAIALNANGFPVSIPLAAVFALFGVGILQTRLYMLAWLFMAMYAIYAFTKTFFDRESAVIGSLLIATFASFYANGKTATGDIPGFIMLLLGIFFILKKEWYITGGSLLALAAVTKTSVYHMVLPAMAITLLFTKKRESTKPIIELICGATVIVILWLLLMLHYPYSISGLRPIINFYNNPINKPSLISRFPSNISFFFSSTLLYFISLLAVISYANKKSVQNGNHDNRLIMFVLVYTVLQTFVFLRSPGWIRYLIGVELLILILLYPSLRQIIQLHVKHKAAPLIISVILMLLHATHYILFSDIFSKPNPAKNAQTINKLLLKNPGSTVGFYEDPITASLIPGNRKYQRVRIGGNTWAGKNPLDNPPEKLPTYVFNFDVKSRQIIDKYYKQITVDGLRIYKKESR